jgi:hypothetical protein
MTKYVAFDVHQATTAASVRGEGGRVLARTILPTEEPAIVEFFRGIHLRIVGSGIDIVKRQLAKQNFLRAPHYVTVPPDQVSHDVPRRPAVNLPKNDTLIERSDRGRECFNTVLKLVYLVFNGHDGTPSLNTPTVSILSSVRLLAQEDLRLRVIVNFRGQLRRCIAGLS